MWIQGDSNDPTSRLQARFVKGVSDSSYPSSLLTCPAGPNGGCRRSVSVDQWPILASPKQPKQDSQVAEVLQGARSHQAGDARANDEYRALLSKLDGEENKRSENCHPGHCAITPISATSQPVAFLVSDFQTYVIPLSMRETCGRSHKLRLTCWFKWDWCKRYIFWGLPVTVTCIVTIYIYYMVSSQ